jgi:radical SAM protein with 4Fe4S-binding SPASM domain
LQKPKFVEKLLVDHWQTVQEVSPPLRRFPEGETWRRTPALLKLRRYLNARRAIGAMKRGAGEIRSYPTYLTIDPFSACNLKCPLCPTGNGRITIKKGKLQLDMFRHIVDEMGAYLYSIDMFNWGEPLLNKDVYEMIAYAHKRHIITSVSSNFHYFDEAAAEQMINSGLDYLILSIDGATQETYEKYRVGGDLATVLQNVRTLTETRRRLGRKTPYIFWQYLVFRHNEWEIEQARQIAMELGVDEFQTELAFLEVDTRAKGEQWIPTQEQYSRYNIRELEPMWAAREAHEAEEQAKLATATMPGRGPGAALELLPARPQADADKPLRRRLPNCLWLYTTAVVNADGSVAPCCAVERKEDSIGSLRGDNSMSGLWNSKEYQAARRYSTRGAESGVETVCHRCVLAPAEGEKR